MNQPLLSVQDLRVVFPTYAGLVYAVNGMSFDIFPREIFGLVGESGCGKSVTGLAIARVLPGKGRITSGKILFDGQDLTAFSEQQMSMVRGRRIAMIFQDPSSSLNPVFSIGWQIERVIRFHTSVSKAEALRRAQAMFAAVSLPNPERILSSYVHELSGGMQQRVMIAMALASGAQLLIADEPTTALDVTIQKQILELLVELRQKENLAIMLITHNLGVVAETCDRVAVAYNGRIVEVGATGDVLHQCAHPYTQGLLAALPSPNQRGSELRSIPGGVPSGLVRLPGCPFHPRCPKVMEVCRTEPPPFFPLEKEGHQAACYLYALDIEKSAGGGVHA